MGRGTGEVDEKDVKNIRITTTDTDDKDDKDHDDASNNLDMSIYMLKSPDNMSINRNNNYNVMSKDNNNSTPQKPANNSENTPQDSVYPQYPANSEITPQHSPLNNSSKDTQNTQNTSSKTPQTPHTPQNPPNPARSPRVSPIRSTNSPIAVRTLHEIRKNGNEQFEATLCAGLGVVIYLTSREGETKRKRASVVCERGNSMVSVEVQSTSKGKPGKLDIPTINHTFLL